MAYDPNQPTIDALIREVDRLMRRRFDWHAREAGLELSRPQYKALLLVGRTPGINQTALAELMEVEPMTVTGLIDRLERRGWIERRPDPNDRRARTLHLLDAALPIVERLHGVIADWRADILSSLEAEAQARLMADLQRLKSHLAAAAEAAPAPRAAAGAR